MAKAIFFIVFVFVFVFVFAAEEYGGLHESLMVEAPLFIEFAILPDVPWTDHELVKQGNFMRTKYNTPTMKFSNLNSIFPKCTTLGV